MQAEGGQTLRTILGIKEDERQAGDGTFWWGVGNSLGTAVQEAAKNSGGTLPILFLMMPSKPQRRDSHPDQVFLWKFWEDRAGGKHYIRQHVLEWSRGAKNKKKHYALVCRLHEPLKIGVHVFDQSRWLTHRGKRPGASQVTALLRGDLDGDHSQGDYCFGFRATLVDPWQVKLVDPQRLSPKKCKLLASWKKGADWGNFVAQFRGKGRHRDSN